MKHVGDLRLTKKGTYKDGRVARRVSARGWRDMVVTLTPEGILMREVGRRTTYTYPYGPAFQRAGKMYADAVVREKAEARKAKRRVR